MFRGYETFGTGRQGEPEGLEQNPAAVIKTNRGQGDVRSALKCSHTNDLRFGNGQTIRCENQLGHRGPKRASRKDMMPTSGVRHETLLNLFM